MRYGLLEKYVLSLIMSCAKLRPYFESHPIIVKTNLPIKTVLRKPELSGRMVKRSVQLSTYDITFEPRTAIKSQALADFVSDFSPNLESDLAKEVNQLENKTSNQQWTLFTDGASNLRGTGLGLVLKSPQGNTIAQAVSCELKATNNETEYEALIARLKADVLASLGSNFTPAIFDKIPIVHILEPTISKPEQVNPVNTDSDSWTKPYYDWFLRGILPQGKHEVRAFKIKASSYSIINNTLFKRSQVGPYLRCLEPHKAKQVLQEIHEGYCGNHKGGRSLASKVLKTGYYWPTLRADCLDYCAKCEACQIHAPIIHQPSELLHSISVPWPFMKWGMDIVGKLPIAQSQKMFMLAMTDYFSKWIEADSFRQVTEKEVISFIRTNIICRYGVPSEIVCDNGTQFVGKRTKAFFDEWNINLATSTPGYPKVNGQAESSNKADWTTPKTSTGQTPYSLVYGCEAVIVVEVHVPTSRYSLNNIEAYADLMHDNLDLAEELRDSAKIRMALYQ
ncbi:uncharacterized protein LOC141602261 [Silene latifolia]|uniref:uncharacterized protein LOC141602261 n=1 Tax=Silene latifolia TaxID=37657 RepID=UPI003D77C1D1